MNVDIYIRILVNVEMLTLTNTHTCYSIYY